MAVLLISVCAAEKTKGELIVENRFFSSLRLTVNGLMSGSRIMFDMGEQYFKGVLAGYLGANFTSGPISKWQIDIIKENISHYCESTVDHSQLSYQEKEERKRQMKQSLEVYIHGVKDEMRATGRMK